MGIVIRQSVKTTLVIFFGALLGALTTYAYVFIFNKPELGFITNFIYQAAIIQVFTLVGTAPLLQIYTQKYQEGGEERKVLITFSCVVVLFANILFSIVYFLLKDIIVGKYQVQDRSYIEQYYWLTPFLVLSWSYMTLMDQYLLSQHKVAISAFVREIILRLLNIISLVLFFYNIITFDQFVLSLVISYIVPSAILLYLATRTKGFGFSFNFQIFKRKNYLEFIHFSWYHLLMIASMSLIGYIDIIMLAPLDKTGVASLAVYRNAIFVVSILSIPYRSIATASFAVLNRTYIEGNKNAISALFNRLGNNLLIVAVGMCVLIACNLDNVVSIFPKGYEAIKPITLILMIGRLVDMATGMNNEVISISKYYKFNFRISSILVLLSFLLMRYMIPIYGIYGAAWAATIALTVFNLGKMVFLWLKMDLQPFNKLSVGIIIAGSVSLIAGYFLPYVLNVIVDTAARSVLVVLIYVSTLLLLKVSPDLKDYLLAIKANKRLF
jgi:O-antigen/teichoic acid export membrane protein